jgi:small ligand-binding sensory domain FIST
MGASVLVPVLVVVTRLAGISAKTQLAKECRPTGELVVVGGHRMHIHCMGWGRPTVILKVGLNDFSIQRGHPVQPHEPTLLANAIQEVVQATEK